MIVILKNQHEFDTLPRDVLNMSEFVAYKINDNMYEVTKDRISGFLGKRSTTNLWLSARESIHGTFI